MATIGNNIKASNAELRDAFFDSPSERQYNDDLESGLFKNRHTNPQGIPNALARRGIIANETRKHIVDKIKIKVDTNHIVLSKNSSYGLGYLLNNVSFNFMDLDLLYSLDNDIKRIVVEALVESADEGLFTEEQMSHIENFISLVLNSIEDCHQELIRERDIVDDEIMSR